MNLPGDAVPHEPGNWIEVAERPRRNGAGELSWEGKDGWDYRQVRGLAREGKCVCASRYEEDRVVFLMRRAE